MGYKCQSQDGLDAEYACVIGNSGKRPEPDGIIWLNLVLITPWPGYMLIPERGTGGLPIALF